MRLSAAHTAHNPPAISVTVRNRRRLERMLAEHAPIRSWRAVEFLVRELIRAAPMDDESAAEDVATMHSRVMFREEGRGTAGIVTLVYPGERDLYDDAMSVLTPLGAALLGLSEGQSISYPGPHGGLKTVTVITVLHQPEAARRSRSATAEPVC
jgi:regulator of nucleoside diphosphate kinase